MSAGKDSRPARRDRGAVDRLRQDRASRLVRHLASLGGETPGRVLALGWPDEDDLEPLGREVVRLAGIADLGPEPRTFDAVVWRIEGSIDEAGDAAFQLDRTVGGRGRVIVVTPLPADAAATSRRRGSLPTREQAGLRRIVRHLSEIGFAIRKDSEPRALAGGAERWRVLAAERDPFVIRPYREGDEEAILRLFAECFPHAERGLDHWRWKYRDNPYGSRLISLAFSPEGELASHYSGYPIPFWRAAAGAPRSFLGLQMGDTMTGAAFRDAGRGKGSLLARTVRHFFALHRDGTFGFFYGFNTGPIQRFCRWFIGGSDTLDVRYRERDLESAPDWPAAGYRVERVEAVGGSFDRFFRRVAPSYGFLVERDARYLHWRYLQCPDARYVVLAAKRWGRLVGWSVFRRRGDALSWGDALFDPRYARAAGPILAAATADPELAGARRIAAWFPDRPQWWSTHLDALGFVARPEPENLGLVALPDGEPQAFEALGELYYTMGDGDLF